jgi:hypothetical protein
MGFMQPPRPARPAPQTFEMTPFRSSSLGRAMLGGDAPAQDMTMGNGTAGDPSSAGTSGRAHGWIAQVVAKVKYLKKRHPFAFCVVICLLAAVVLVVVMGVALESTRIARGRPF